MFISSHKKYLSIMVFFKFSSCHQVENEGVTLVLCQRYYDQLIFCVDTSDLFGKVFHFTQTKLCLQTINARIIAFNEQSKLLALIFSKAEPIFLSVQAVIGRRNIVCSFVLYVLGKVSCFQWRCEHMYGRLRVSTTTCITCNRTQ